MDFLEIVSTYGYVTLVSLAFLSFVAGFIDAVVGGGGLIQLPALLINFPQTPLATILGTNKIAALSGTSIAAYQYAKKIQFNYRLLFVVSCCSALASYAGAKIVSFIDVATLKPIMLVILIAIAGYTFAKRDLGTQQTGTVSTSKQLLYGSLIGLVVGFYDGFFGPGTGSFFVLGFVVLLGFEFLEASAYAKVINCMTNISALLVFVRQGSYFIELAVLMSCCNMLGNIIGVKIALKKGNQFVRLVFLCIVLLMIVRYSYDVFKSSF